MGKNTDLHAPSTIAPLFKESLVYQSALLVHVSEVFSP